MGQVTIYLDKEIEQKMVLAAQAANLSKSKWITSIIQQNIANDWSESVQQLAGSWGDFPTLDELRSTNGLDAPREPI